MYYRAEIRKKDESYIHKTIMAGNIHTLKRKLNVFINDDSIGMIEIYKVTEEDFIGYAKVVNELKEVLKDEIIIWEDMKYDY